MCSSEPEFIPDEMDQEKTGLYFGLPLDTVYRH
jgi:hypothetical protein